MDIAGLSLFGSVFSTCVSVKLCGCKRAGLLVRHLEYCDFQVVPLMPFRHMFCVPLCLGWSLVPS